MGRGGESSVILLVPETATRKRSKTRSQLLDQGVVSNSPGNKEMGRVCGDPQ